MIVEDSTTCFGLAIGPSSGCSQNYRGDYILGVVNIWGTRSRLISWFVEFIQVISILYVYVSLI